jgi:hypothetical protein
LRAATSSVLAASAATPASWSAAGSRPAVAKTFLVGGTPVSTTTGGPSLATSSALRSSSTSRPEST